jgi:RND family efflux transporter MFP subunit
MRFIASALILLLAVLTGCSRSGSQAEAASKSAIPEPLAVRVAAAEARALARTISVTGSLNPDETVSVSAEVAGRLAKVHVDFGQSVRKGQVIAELDRREFAIQHERARAALAQALARIGLDPGQEEVTPESTPAMRQARALLEDARFKYENSMRLAKTGDISRERANELEKTYRAREAAYQAAEDELRTQLASVQALRAEVKLAQKQLDDATVQAPFDGSVAARLASPGQYLRENAPILTLIKAHPLRLRLEVPESGAGEVRVGTPLEFTTDAVPGVRFRAVVRELNPALEERSRSLVAEARLSSEDPRLRPGMFVQVDLRLTKDATAVVVPQQALYRVAGLTKVFVVRDGRALERKITPGRQIDGWVEVPGEGIHPGETVAVSKLAMLVDGLPVKVESGR